jgi:CubicO group peptidase (beta-lactamase class C family)
MTWPTGLEGLQEMLASRALERPFAGAQLYASRYGQTLVDVAVGEAGPGRSMTPRSLLYLSCAAKPLLAAAAGRLVDEGVIRFGDPVCRHLPSFAVGGKQEITIEDVLSHAGGFRFRRSPGPYREPFDLAVRGVLEMPIESGWRSGEDQGYHQETAWYVLAALLESVRAQEFPAVVRAEICEPLNLESMWVTVPAATYPAVEALLAVPTYVSPGGIRRSPYLVTEAACRTKSPCYGSYGTMRDLGRFYEAAVDGVLGRGTAFPVHAQTLRSMTGSVRGPQWDRTWRRECEYGRGFMRDLSHHWGFGSRWSAFSFGYCGLVGHVCAGADPETGVVLACSFGALTVDDEDTGYLVDRLHDFVLGDRR